MNSGNIKYGKALDNPPHWRASSRRKFIPIDITEILRIANA
jgi:hypothetical protein